MLPAIKLKGLYDVQTHLSSGHTEYPYDEPLLESTKLFKYIWKFSGKPEGRYEGFGRNAFFGEKGCITSKAVKLQAIKHILSKNTRLYLLAVLEALREETLDQAARFLSSLETFDPLVLEEIRKISEEPFELSNIPKAYDAIEKTFVSYSLKLWAENGTEDELRNEASTCIITYLDSPENTELSLRELNLKTLPDIFMAQAFANLRNFDIQLNQLKTLPTSFGQLTGLEELLLNNNRITTLPDSFVHLKNLKFLNLNHNKLSHFPNVLCSLTQLIRLWLDNNKLTHIPYRLDQLTKLESLILNNNQLSSFPLGIPKLIRLNELWLNNNGLTELPLSLGHLTELETIGLKKNRLSSLPDTFSNLTKLRNLGIGENRFLNFPHIICSLTSLRILGLNNNSLSTLPETFTNLTELHSLSLTANRFQAIPELLIDLPKLENLRFNENPLNPKLEPRENWVPSIHTLINPALEKHIASFYSSPPPPLHSLSLHPQIITWLNALKRHMCDYTIEASREHLKASVRSFLQEAEKNKVFRDLFLEIIDESSHSCIDGLTLSLLHLNLAKLQVNIDIRNLPETYKALSTLHIFHMLETIAKQKIRDLKATIDESISNGTYAPTEDQMENGPHAPVIRVEREILLIYPARLAGRFELPIDVTEMLFGAITEVTDTDIAHAEATVQRFIENEENLHAHLLENPLWEEALKINNPAKYRHITLEAQTLALSNDPEILSDLHRIRMRNLSLFSLESVAHPEPKKIPQALIPSLQNIAKLPLQAYEKDILERIQNLNKFVNFNITKVIITTYNLDKSIDYPPLAENPNLFNNEWKSVDSLLLLEIATTFLRGATPPSQMKTKNASQCAIA